MENQVVEMSLPNGSTALARVTVLDGGGAEKVGAAPKFDFDGVGRTLEGITTVLKGAVDRAAPDRVTVELGLEIAARSGKLTGLVVEGEGRGSISVTLEWSGGSAGKRDGG